MEGTIGEASKALGISQNAVRQRIRRGSLTGTKRGRRVYVAYDPPDSTAADTAAKEEPSQASELSAVLEAILEAKDEIIANLKEEIASLKGQLDRKDRQIEGALTISMAQRTLEGPGTSWWQRLLGKG